MNSRGFHHIAIQVHDVEKVTAFYRDTLGLPELSRHFRDDGSLRSVWVAARTNGDVAGGFLAIEEFTDTRRGPLGFSMVAFGIAASERAALQASLKQAGLEILKETGFTFYVHDPEGNVVGISHYPDAAVV